MDGLKWLCVIPLLSLCFLDLGGVECGVAFDRSYTGCKEVEASILRGDCVSPLSYSHSFELRASVEQMFISLA